MKILGMKFGNDLGSQIGKTSKSGLQTFVKTNKNGQKFFTTVNAKTKDVIPTVKEQVVNPIKDSLQKVGKDTLNLTKQLLKK